MIRKPTADEFRERKTVQALRTTGKAVMATTADKSATGTGAYLSVLAWMVLLGCAVALIRIGGGPVALVLLGVLAAAFFVHNREAVELKKLDEERFLRCPSGIAASQTRGAWGGSARQGSFGGAASRMARCYPGDTGYILVWIGASLVTLIGLLAGGIMIACALFWLPIYWAVNLFHRNRLLDISETGLTVRGAPRERSFNWSQIATVRRQSLSPFQLGSILFAGSTRVIEITLRDTGWFGETKILVSPRLLGLGSAGEADLIDRLVSFQARERAATDLSSMGVVPSGTPRPGWQAGNMNPALSRGDARELHNYDMARARARSEAGLAPPFATRGGGFGRRQ